MPLNAPPPREPWQKPTAVQIHVALNDITPPVWRRLIVPLATTLAELHLIIQAAFGWTDAHLHEFEIGGLRYGNTTVATPDEPEDLGTTFEASDVRLRDFSRKPGTAFAYIYDFGDHWVHTVTLEKLAAISPAPKTAVCVEGARCCPPEDVGGSGGYEEFLRVLFNPDDDERDEQKHMKRWSGGKFDPEKFDIAKTDKAVRGALRRMRVVD
jgi:Plasmid pRiA4b ORF-3-like protein